MQSLAVPFVDARPEDLSWQLGLDRQTALDDAHYTFGPVKVELRLLGSSHQVLVEVGGAIVCSETVACIAGGAHFPADAQEEAYAFQSEVQILGPDYEAEVRRLAERMSGNERSLGGRFPGHPLAMTGIELLRLDEFAVRWQTWHGYPNQSTMVLTRSLLSLAGTQ